MKRTRFILLAFVGIGGMSLLDAQIDRSFWKSGAEIDEFYGNAASERGAAVQHASLASIRDRISMLDQYPDSENIGYLGEKLWKLSRGNIYQLKERFEVYDKVQETLLSIPGHARYFADDIKRVQKKVESSPNDVGRGSYDYRRGIHFLTMSYLPSPETIAVLGDFLADDKDQPGPRKPSESYDYDVPLANCHYAAEALDKIGLRNPPVPEARHQVYPLAPEDYLPYALEWWEEIKSGKKAFSFVGQDVEYRFKPDGTWETIHIANPPGKGAEAVPAATEERPMKRPASAPLESRKTSHGRAWWWYAVIGITLLALGAWLWRKKTA